jgi:hypothetical protein
MKHIKGRRFSDFTVYHQSTAGDPDAHKDGPWFYEPHGWEMNEVYSDGYATYHEALRAAMTDLSWRDE